MNKRSVLNELKKECQKYKAYLREQKQILPRDGLIDKKLKSIRSLLKHLSHSNIQNALVGFNYALKQEKKILSSPRYQGTTFMKKLQYILYQLPGIGRLFMPKGARLSEKLWHLHETAP